MTQLPSNEVALTAAESAFLRERNLSEHDVFDARGLPTELRKHEAKRLGKAVIIGAPCGAAGHRLRTRSGHCIQCDPSKIAFAGRSTMSGYVYIAGSMKGRVIKVGSTTDVEQRIKLLRQEQYGGLYDWEILFHAKFELSGHVELRVHSHLKKYQILHTYEKNQRQQKASELFKCNFGKALKAISEIVELEGTKPSHLKLYAHYKRFEEIE